MTKQNWQTVGKIALLGLVFLFLTRLISEVAFLLAQPVYQSLRAFDPDGSFLYISLHHALQGLFALFAILLLARMFRISPKDFGFNLNEWRYAVRLVLQFSLFWFFLQGSIGVLLMVFGDTSAAFHFPLTAWNFGGYFAFQILISGTSEEILFRALVMTPLLLYGKRSELADKTNALLAGGIATLIFMLAHINIAFDPLRVTHFNPLQQLTVFTFGSFYAYLFVKTRSLLGPILAHNLLNAVIVAIGLILYFIFG
ncbi:MAG: CPBP family intramembrane metalloprotease [Anaerolineae bacterium]|nr:CPBP family intramembrane metalloprotease [Anaerolineae bacterium]